MGTVVERKDLLEIIIYADRGYIADMYEAITGTRPHTTITRNQGKKAGASVPLFSAELSATESRSYEISTNEMLAEILPSLQRESSIDGSTLARRMASKIGWIDGEAYGAAVPVRRALPAFAGMGRLDGRPAAGAAAAVALNRSSTFIDGCPARPGTA